MNWIKFVENHNSTIRLPRIGRSAYSYTAREESHTLQNWFRDTQKKISNN
jgi:hypothetical protein